MQKSYSWLVVLLFLFCGCSFYKTISPLSTNTNQELLNIKHDALAELEKRNQTLKGIKGIGYFSLNHPDYPKLSHRIAWVATTDKKIRLVVLAVGQPLYQLACDGNWFYSIDPSGHYSKIPFSKLLSFSFIPDFLSYDELVEYLMGKLPIQPYKKSQIKKISDNNYLITIRNSYFSKSQHLYFKDLILAKLVFYKSFNRLSHQSEFHGQLVMNNYCFYKNIRISSPHGDYIHLKIEKLWPNPTIPDSTFIIKSNSKG